MGGGIMRELRLSAFRGRVASAEGRVGPESIKQNCNFAPTFVRRGVSTRAISKSNGNI